jgi:hypothetical protein
VFVFASSIGAVVAKRFSTLSIDEHGVAVRNFPWHVRRFPLDAVDRFDQVEGERTRSRVRFTQAAILLRDGSRVPVYSVGDPALATGVTMLNNRLAEARRLAIQSDASD